MDIKIFNSYNFYMSKSFVLDYINYTNSNNCTNILPVGSGQYNHSSIKWTRPTKFSDFDIIYKGIEYKVKYKDLQIICNKIRTDFDFESTIKTYIDNNMQIDITICHLLV